MLLSEAQSISLLPLHLGFYGNRLDGWTIERAGGR
jgi:hypothetical protein